MLIIAVLLTLTASGLLKARDQATASDAAENLLSLLREAQNRSVSVTRGNVTTPKDTKAWGVLVDRINNQIKLVYLDPANSVVTNQLTTIPKETPSFNTGVSFQSKMTGGATDTQYRYILYSAPFGKAYTYDNSACGNALPTSCYWAENSNQIKDWVPSATYNDFDHPADEVTLIVTYKSIVYNIIVNSKGDAYIE